VNVRYNVLGAAEHGDITNGTSGLTGPPLPHVDIILASKRPAEKAQKIIYYLIEPPQAPRPHHIVPRNEMPKIPHEEAGSQWLVAAQRMGTELDVVGHQGDDPGYFLHASLSSPPFPSGRARPSARATRFLSHLHENSEENKMKSSTSTIRQSD